MIFVTVGAQMPFDRLIHAVDAWAGAHPDVNCFAQIGSSDAPPRHMPFRTMLTPSEFMVQLRAARLIVAHAGMGSILQALEHAKPIVVLPRRSEFSETRNDHQVATATRFAGNGRVHAAMREAELGDVIDRVLKTVSETGGTPEQISAFASPTLIQALSRFIHEGAKPGGPSAAAGR